MCGIAGVYCFNEDAKKYSTNLERAVSSLTSRGPDDKGFFYNQNIGLGHTRLSIIDTSSAGSQPFVDASGKYALVFNGEFYNYQDYKAELITDGVMFKSESDTEVLLYMLIKYGSSTFEKINGCFSFAFYNHNDNTCLIARDRMGINPLVYYQDEERIVFGSELKSLIAYGIPRVLNTASLYTYFQLNYLPTNSCILQDTYKLEPGHYLEIRDNQITTHQYYKIHRIDTNIESSYDSYPDAKIRLRELISASVKRRLVADVPLGCFLSGGIDSTIITALAAQHSPNINTFSIGFKDDSYFDETSHAEVVAKKYNTTHTSFQISSDDMLHNLGSALDYIDEPFADSSALAVNILSKLTRQKATVALSGDGADEMFAGYNKHSAHFNASYARAKEKIAAAMNPLWKVVPKSRNSRTANFARQLDRFASGYKLSPDERYWFWASIGVESYAKNLIKTDVDYQQYSKSKLQYLSSHNDFSDINTVLLTDMQLVLQGDMLTKVDLMSMANSLEVRTPFLDHTVVDYAFSLPASYKITANNRKKILKDSFSDLIPEELLNRPKHGFEVPLQKWFKKELWSLIDEDLLSEKFIKEQQLFNYEIISTLKKKIFSANPEDAPAKIWALIVFQNWWKKYYI